MTDLKFEYAERWPQLRTDLPADVVAVLEERDRDLEDFLANLETGGGGSSLPPFTIDGDLRLTTSLRYTEKTQAREIVELFASLKTAGTTNTVVALRKNGSSVQSLTILASANTASVTGLSIPLALDDYLQIQITTRGAGAQGLEVRPLES